MKLHWLRRIYHFWRAVVVHFFEVDATSRAGNLAYSSLLAAVPLTVLALSIFSVTPLFHEYTDEIERFLFSHFIASSADTIRQHIHDFAVNAPTTSVTSIFFLFIVGILLIFKIESSLNAVWKLPQPRHSLKAFFLYATATMITPILLGVGIALSLYFIVGQPIPDLGDAPLSSSPFLSIVAFLLELVAFTLLYKLLPNTKVVFLDAFKGAIVATSLFEIVKIAFGFTIDHLQLYSNLYGALAAIPIFLVWLYLSWNIALIGAVVSYIAQKRQF